MGITTSTDRTRSGSERRRKGALVHARLTDEELDQVRRVASNEGKSVSELIRSRVLVA
jgi:hypothetical protein